MGDFPAVFFQGSANYVMVSIFSSHNAEKAIPMLFLQKYKSKTTCLPINEIN